MDCKEFRSLFLLLNKDLKERNIQHCITITKQILKLHKHQVEHLSSQMLVSTEYLIN